MVTGDVALKFFPEKTKLPSEVLGEVSGNMTQYDTILPIANQRCSEQIWQIADTEDKGFLTPAGFGIILRLIGYAQAGRQVSAELALRREFSGAEWTKVTSDEV